MKLTRCQQECQALDACAIGPSVSTSPTDFSFQNLIFWNLFEFSGAEITLKLNIFPHF